jgi:nucleoside-diphosphate-sugar epimerase
MSGRRIALVTGASGFVGGHLVEALVARGWTARCLMRPASSARWLPPSVEIAGGDVADGTPAGVAALERAVRGTSVVFHLAAVTSARTDEDYLRVNARGTERLAGVIARVAPDAALVLCSSLAAAGPPPSGRPAREGEPEHPVSAYGRSKLAAERALARAAVRSVIVRPSAVYGPRDVDILAAFRLAARGLALRLAPPGQRLSMIHARDLAAGLVTAAERDARGVYYMSDGVVHAWEGIIAALGDAVGRRPRIVAVPHAVVSLAAHADRTLARLMRRKPLLTPDRARELAEPEWTCDDTRARLELGYTSPTALADGFRETAEWYRAHGWL